MSLAVTELVPCTRLYMYIILYSCIHTCKYMYTDVCTYCTFVYTHGHIHVHVHTIHLGAQCVSHSDRVCVLQVDVCIRVYCAVVDTNMDGCLAVTDRVGVL